MLPIVVILLLAPVIFATNEFPDLMSHIKVTWDGVDLTSQLDARLTSSLDNQLPYFFLCGPFKTSGIGGQCTITFSYNGRKSDVDTQFLTSYDDNTYTCMRFENPVSNFMQNKRWDWNVQYNCDTAKPYAKYFLFCFTALFVSSIIGWVAFSFGAKSAAKNRPLAASNFGLNHGGNQPSGAFNQSNPNPMYTAPTTSYGNPFTQPNA